MIWLGSRRCDIGANDFASFCFKAGRREELAAAGGLPGFGGTYPYCFGAIFEGFGICVTDFPLLYRTLSKAMFGQFHIRFTARFRGIALVQYGTIVRFSLLLPDALVRWSF